jgi:hypothetical protein
MPRKVEDYPESVAVGDFNNDNKTDLIVSIRVESSIVMLLGHGNEDFSIQRSFPAGTSANWMAVTDFNEDKCIDIVTANNNHDISILLGNGDGSFKPEMRFQTSYYPACIAVADFNADNHIDLVVLTGFNTVDVFLGNGNGHFCNEGECFYQHLSDESDYW